MKIDKSVLGAILAPMGLAVAPVFSVWKTNGAEVPFSELIRPLPVVIAAAVLISGFFLALFRRKADAAHRATLLASGFWLLFWGYSFLRDKLSGLAILVLTDALMLPDRWGIPVWLVLTAGLLTALGFVRRGLPAIAGGLGAMSGLLVVLALPWQGIRRLTPPAPPPTPSAQVRVATDSRPDIYVIVLDGYARADVLRTLYQYDDSLFLEGLKSRGFQVAPKSQANYIQTALAVGSLLRMDYWPPSPGSSDAVAKLVELGVSCPLKEYMAAHEYRSVSYLSSGPLTEGLLKETVMETGEAPTLWSSLESLLLDISPLTILPRGEEREYANHRQRLKNTLKRLSAPPPGSEPYLVLCHVLLPHPPFVFGPKGEERTPPIPYSIGDATGYRGNGEEYGQAYSDQVQWIGPQILQAIDSLRKASPRPAAILLMGDHGSRRYTDWSGAEHTYMPEAFGNLLAVSVPDGVKARFGTLPENATPLPTFRRLLNAVLQEDLPALPDRSYYSTLSKGFDFIDVSAEARKPVSLEEAKRIHPDTKIRP